MASDESAGGRSERDELPSWIVTILGIGSVAVGAVRPEAGALAARVLVLVALVIVARHRLRTHGRPSWTDVTDPWVLAWVAGASCALVLPIPEAGIGRLAAAVLLASLLVGFGAGFTIWDRLRSAALHVLVEGGIATSAAALMVWVLFIDAPDRDVDGAVIAAYVATACALAAAWVTAVLVRSSGGEERVSVRLLGLAVVAVGVCAAVVLAETLDVVVPDVARTALGLATLTFATAGVLHPSNDLLLAPAVVQSPRVDLRRSATVLAGVLVGPVLVGIAVASGREISLLTAIGGGILLSVVIALYVLSMVRRWGDLEHEIAHDPLTGLPNRTLFQQRLDLAIARSLRDRRLVALMFLDLDRFKNVNDSLGHDAGDDLLRAVAKRLSEIVKGEATVARIAGDEFAIILPKVNSPEHSEAIARQIVRRFSSPFTLGRRKLYVTPSIGIAHFPTDAREAGTLLEAADSAMYRAKEQGRNTVSLYTESTRSGAVARLDIESALHDALRAHQLQVKYQPKLDIRTGEIAGAEALVRWQHPTLGFIPPEQFIAVAEESGLIEQIGEWVLYEAARQTVEWVAKGLPAIVIAVNLSPRQFQLASVPDMVARVLRQTGLPGRFLELEITENLALQDPTSVQAALIELRSMGVRMAIDDFGVGYSGLEYLERFQFDAIKIDRTFVRKIDESGGPIVKAVIAMAKGLGLEVIAEGVETRSQLDFLRRHGCDQMQGFLLSRPVAAEEMEAMLRTSAARAVARHTAQQTPGPAVPPAPRQAAATARPVHH
jgi:diguanylate cyclase (GGDEF)-like protein